MVVFQHLAKGQPLQPDSTCPPARFGRFQSLYRGTAFATVDIIHLLLLRLKPSFNPSTEGQPLQRHVRDSGKPSF